MTRFCHSVLRILIFPAAGIACYRKGNEHYSNGLASGDLAFRFRFDRTGEDPTEIQSGLRISGGANMKIQTHKPVVMNAAVWFVMLSPLTVLVVGLVGALLVG
jgi:hypothetical protein